MIDDVLDAIVKAETEAAALVEQAHARAAEIGADAIREAEEIKRETDAECKAYARKVMAESDHAAAAAARVVFEKAESDAKKLTAAGEAGLAKAAALIEKTVMEF